VSLKRDPFGYTGESAVVSQHKLDDRLSGISTVWSVLREAHAGQSGAARAAHQALVQRYGEAVYRYLLAAVHDPHTADDLSQEFAFRLVNGNFRAVDPSRGRFRDYVKAVLFHMVRAYRKQRRARPLEGPDPAVPAADLDRQFISSWREALLSRAWESLAAEKPSLHKVLRLRADHPDMSSQVMAEHLTEDRDKPVSAAAIRQALRRARQKFADLLLDEVAHSLDPPTADLLEQELIDLDLMSYCRPSLERYARQR